MKDVTAAKVPWSIFHRNRSTLRKGLLTPIHEGIVPEKLFSPRSRIVSLLHLSRTIANSPMKLLFARQTGSGLCSWNLLSTPRVSQKPAIPPLKFIQLKCVYVNSVRSRTGCSSFSQILNKVGLHV